MPALRHGSVVLVSRRLLSLSYDVQAHQSLRATLVPLHRSRIAPTLEALVSLAKSLVETGRRTIQDRRFLHTLPLVPSVRSSRSIATPQELPFLSKRARAHECALRLTLSYETHLVK